MWLTCSSRHTYSATANNTNRQSLVWEPIGWCRARTDTTRRHDKSPVYENYSFINQ